MQVRCQVFILSDFFLNCACIMRSKFNLSDSRPMMLTVREKSLRKLWRKAHLRVHNEVETSNMRIDSMLGQQRAHSFYT